LPTCKGEVGKKLRRLGWYLGLSDFEVTNSVKREAICMKGLVFSINRQ
jgi:hypothetical protein